MLSVHLITRGPMGLFHTVHSINHWWKLASRYQYLINMNICKKMCGGGGGGRGWGVGVGGWEGGVGGGGGGGGGGATTQASGNDEKSSHRKIVQSLEPEGF